MTGPKISEIPKSISYRELLINIENAHFTLMTDGGLLVTKKQTKYAHVHTYYEFFIVVKGHMELHFDKHTEELRENDLVIVAPGTYHYTTTSSEDLIRYNINITVEKNNLKTPDDCFGKVSSVLNGIEESYIENLPSLPDLTEKLVYCKNNDFKKAYFHEFIMSVCDIIGGGGVKAPVDEILGDAQLLRSYKIEKIIFSCYMYDISLDYIAKRLYLSSKQVNRIIKKEFGCSFHELLVKQRMNVACKLLDESKVPIDEISGMVGYTTCCGFYNAFKTYVGLTPGEYRKKAKTKENLAK